MSAWMISTGAWTKDLYPEENGFPIALDGQSSYIPTPLIFQVAGLATLLALIPLAFVKQHTRTKAS